MRPMNWARWWTCTCCCSRTKISPAAVAHWIRERHYNAEWALSAQLEVLARQFDEMEDDYLRERKADVEQVVRRVLSVLAGEVSAADAVAQRVISQARTRCCWLRLISRQPT